jgi:hypothetical protein
MVRGVIKLQSVIGSVLLDLCQKIPGCVYKPDKHEAIFSYQGQIVNIDSRQIIINESVKVSDAHELMNWVQGIAVKLTQIDLIIV